MQQISKTTTLQLPCSAINQVMRIAIFIGQKFMSWN